MSLYIGTNYHPHDWPKERWEKDFQLMKEAGFDTVRLGHLCWDSYEPEDGVYTFEWFDQVMELCVKYKLNVILDVSMHPAPIWVHKLCPGCNVGGKNGAPQAPLRRYMDDVSDPEYQKYALRFAEKIVSRYKNHPALFAFGLCNELGAGYPSYSEASKKRFQKWLEKKYKTIKALNHAWATQRWSRKLSSFEDVAMQVNEYEIGAPEAWLDMRRFFSDGIADFITELAETVEQNVPGKAHTSNHFAEYETLGFDYLKTASGFVDYPGIGFYPGYGNRESMGFWKTGSWYMKRIAKTGKPMWCIEFVTGGFGIHHAAMGMNRMYAFWCLLHRMQMMLGWTWRSMLNGEEQYLTGMLNHDGRPNENYREYQWIASDFRKLEKYGFPYLPQPEIAVSYSYDSELMAAYAKMQYRMPYSNNLAIAHRILEERNLDYNVVDLHQMTEQYQILIIPGEIVMDHEQENTVREFVKNGGTAIMTGYSAWVKETGQVFDTSRPGNLTDVFGIEIVGYQRTAGMEVSEKEEQKLRRNPANGRELLKVREKWIDVDYYEQIKATDAEVLQREETHQIPAITRNRYGKGAAYYLFCETEPELLGEVLDECCREKSMQSVVTPQGVIGRKIAENQYFYVNLTGKEQKIELPENGYGVLQEKKMEDTCTLQAFDGELVIC